jgi:SAM-dependent methyltransferase
MVCLDVGCGGGDVARELARRLGVAGQVVGLDMDAAQLQIVRAETAAQNIHNIDYRVADEPSIRPRKLRSCLHPLSFEPFGQASRGAVVDGEVFEFRRCLGRRTCRPERLFLLSAIAGV